MKTHPPMLRRLVVALGIFATCTVACAQATLTSVPLAFKSRTVVLVHGFFADGSGWKDVIERLQAAHVNVVAVQNPLTSLAADVEATRRVVDRLPGPVVLVGHSYGGFVITNAGVDPKVVSLVYVAAFAPDVGETIDTLLAGYPTPPWEAKLVADDAGGLTLTESDYVRYFAPDLPSNESRAFSATQGASSGTLFADPATAASWHTLPSWYVLAEDDQIIDPDAQRFMSSRIHAKVTRVRSSHSVMVSHPDVVAAVIVEAFLHP